MSERGDDILNAVAKVERKQFELSTGERRARLKAQQDAAQRDAEIYYAGKRVTLSHMALLEGPSSAFSEDQVGDNSTRRAGLALPTTSPTTVYIESDLFNVGAARELLSQSCRIVKEHRENAYGCTGYDKVVMTIQVPYWPHHGRHARLVVTCEGLSQTAHLEPFDRQLEKLRLVAGCGSDLPKGESK